MKRNVAAAMAAGIALMVSAIHHPAKADVLYDYTITGTYAGGTLSGTLTFDATSGLVSSANIDASSVGTFSNILPGQGAPFFSPADWLVTIGSGGPNALGLGLETYASLSSGSPTTLASFTSFTSQPFDQPFSGSLQISAAVPEPSTWAMMMLGFAGLGFLASRRRPKAASMAA
jgi:hypothetical protein